MRVGILNLGWNFLFVRELRILLLPQRYLHMAETFPTNADFSGTLDRSAIDAAIAAEEARRKVEGRQSRSYATPLPD